MSEGLSGKLLLCLKSRSIVVIVYTWPAIISFLISSISASTFSAFDFIRVITAVTLVGYGVYFYNDLMDIEDDRKNKEVGSQIPGNRPIGSGQVTEGELKTFMALSPCMSLRSTIGLTPRASTVCIAIRSMIWLLNIPTV